MTNALCVTHLFCLRFDSVYVSFCHYKTNTKLVRNATKRERVSYLIHRSKSKCAYRIECNLSRMGEYHTRVRVWRYVIYSLPVMTMTTWWCAAVVVMKFFFYLAFIRHLTICSMYALYPWSYQFLLDARTIWNNKKGRKWRVKSNTALTAPIKPQHTHIIS